jgi:hypothetical protein
VCKWDRSRALAAFESFGLHGTSASLAIYWLSLWDGDHPPVRGTFNPAQIKDLLPAIAITEVRPSGNALCRLSGSFIDMAIGQPLLGVDVVNLVENEQQQQIRRMRLRALVDGGVALSRVLYEGPSGEDAFAEVLQLPFYGAMEDGSRQFLSHSSWRPTMSRPNSPGRIEYAGMPVEYYAVSLL